MTEKEAQGISECTCPVCGAIPGEDCRPTGRLTALDAWWLDYRRHRPHDSRTITLLTKEGQWTT